MPGAAATSCGGPALLAQHHRKACTRAFLVKNALIHGRKQLRGLNHRRMRACTLFYGVVPAGRAPPGNSGAAFVCQGLRQLAVGGPPCWHNTIQKRVRAHPAMIQATKLLPFVNKCIFRQTCARTRFSMVLCQQGVPRRAILALLLNASDQIASQTKSFV